VCADCVVEVVEWSPDGSMVVLGLSGGAMFVLDAETTDIVFSMVTQLNVLRVWLHGYISVSSFVQETTAELR